MSSTITAPATPVAPVDDEGVRPGARVPDLFPFARQPVWVMVAGRPLKERAVLEFLIAHVNEQTGRLTAFPGVRTIAEAVGLAARAVRCAIDGLIEFGAVEVVPTYLDRVTGERTFEPTTGGAPNAQTSNTYTPCLTPPGGMLYPGPITLAEWYDQRNQNDPRKGRYRGLIDKRIAEVRARQSRVRTTRTPQNPSSGGGAFAVPPPGYRSRTGGGVPQMHPEEDQGDLDQGESVRPSVSVTRVDAREARGCDDAPGAPLPGEPSETDGRTENPPTRNTATSQADKAGELAPTVGGSSLGAAGTGGDLTHGGHDERAGQPGRRGSGPRLQRAVEAPEIAVAARAELLSTADTLLAEQAVTDALSRLDCRSSQRARLVELVAGVLDQGYELDRVRGYVLAKCRETTSRRMSYLLGAFSPDHVGDLADATPVPSPKVVAAQTSERAAQRAAQRQAAQHRRERDTAVVRVSPVGWVTDQQFRVLSPGDRSILTTTAGRSEAELTAFDRQRLRRVRTRLSTGTLQPA